MFISSTNSVFPFAGLFIIEVQGLPLDCSSDIWWEGSVILKPYYQVGQSTAARRSVASNSASGEGAGGHTLVTLPRADSVVHRATPQAEA